MTSGSEVTDEEGQGSQGEQRGGTRTQRAGSRTGGRLSSSAAISAVLECLEPDNEQYDLDLSALVGPDPKPMSLDADTDGDGDGDGNVDGENATISVYAKSTYHTALSGYPSKKKRLSEELDMDNGVDCATLDSAQTIYAGDIDYIYENGRRYCGEYFMPCDEDEQTRQWLVHSVLKQLFDSELTTVPLADPRYILDVGTGIGEWAIAAAERWPECEVFGTDIAPLQPTGQVPVNVEFNIEDAEDEWIRDPDRFDLVHLQNLAGAFADWPFIYRQAYLCTRPGGYIEVLDFDDAQAFECLKTLFPEQEASSSPIHVLTAAWREAAVRHRRPTGVAHMDPSLLADAGFVDVRSSHFDMGIGHRENRAFGNKWLLAICLGMEANFMRLCTRYMGWDGDYVKALCRELELETRNMADNPARAERFVIQLRVLVGRKPEVPTSGSGPGPGPGSGQRTACCSPGENGKTQAQVQVHHDDDKSGDE